MTPLFGPQRLLADLEALGFKAEIIRGKDGNDYVVIPTFDVHGGRFTGRNIGLGLLAPANYPQGICSSIHVRANPQLFDYSDSKSGVRNIVKSVLGEEWRYWSINFNWNGERTTRHLIFQVNGVFDRA
jgi:hypothetical protein